MRTCCWAQNTFLPQAMSMFVLVLFLLLASRAVFVFPIMAAHNYWARDPLPLRHILVAWCAPMHACMCVQVLPAACTCLHACITSLLHALLVTVPGAAAWLVFTKSYQRQERPRSCNQ